MTTDFNPARQCTGKVRYASKKLAKSAIKNTQTDFGRAVLGPNKLVAYKCPHCPWFHFGHVSPELRERLKPT